MTNKQDYITILAMLSTLKNWLTNRSVILFLLLFLLCSLSFGLGYLLAKEGDRAPIIIETGN